MVASLTMGAMDFELWIKVSARAQPITARAIAPFVNVKSVFLIWLETTDCPRDQNRIAQLFESHRASD
jgi:hypothetical protein